MKNFALLAAFVLLALAVPTSAAEISSAAPAATLEQLTDTPAPLFMQRPALTPRCHVVHGTSCNQIGAERPCTDICFSQLECTCTHLWPDNGFWFWYCDQEC